MRLPRFRFTVRGMMVAVAIVALGIAARQAYERGESYRPGYRSPVIRYKQNESIARMYAADPAAPSSRRGGVTRRPSGERPISPPECGPSTRLPPATPGSPSPPTRPSRNEWQASTMIAPISLD